MNCQFCGKKDSRFISGFGPTCTNCASERVEMAKKQFIESLNEHQLSLFRDFLSRQSWYIINFPESRVDIESMGKV